MLANTLLPQPDAYVIVDRQRASANGFLVAPTAVRNTVNLQHLLPKAEWVPPSAISEVPQHLPGDIPGQQEPAARYGPAVLRAVRHHADGQCRLRNAGRQDGRGQRADLLGGHVSARGCSGRDAGRHDHDQPRRPHQPRARRPRRRPRPPRPRRRPRRTATTDRRAYDHTVDHGRHDRGDDHAVDHGRHDRADDHGHNDHSVDRGDGGDHSGRDRRRVASPNSHGAADFLDPVEFLARQSDAGGHPDSGRDLLDHRDHEHAGGNQQ